MERISRLIAGFALLGTAACGTDGPLAPQISPEPKDGQPAAQADVTPAPDAVASRPPTVILRCGGSISAQGAPPLYLVDGREITSLETLDPGTIDAIEVVKGAAAVARYGPRAATGAVLITTHAVQAPSPD
ncbi:TonB-dependent receptor plug domain-containing protein [Longimicrobium sp.]|uniref:TonB-dependent receptor plug domain-containing protein n=1 Tax=Longimicrobium sp. TaxID=2029185 RepID=UPI002E3041C1|nr:TonB-dependent receptor plug domain-containing protein [Longimicrobium sp.]HEX6041729.1 TonB-dependent receptor plug domain-containing protein [Longimicrobium sp.]